MGNFCIYRRLLEHISTHNTIMASDLDFLQAQLVVRGILNSKSYKIFWEMCSEYHHLGRIDEDCDGKDSYGVS
jgi:hypothetical protein